MTDRPTRRTEREPQRLARRHLSDLQQRMVQWIQDDLRRRQKLGEDGVPFPELLLGMATDKASVLASLRQLMRKGMVTVELPRGGWTRMVGLTELGTAQAHRLTHQARTPEEPKKRRRAEKRERDRRKRDRRFRR